jgi:hypothetical protein
MNKIPNRRSIWESSFLTRWPDLIVLDRKSKKRYRFQNCCHMICAFTGVARNLDSGWLMSELIKSHMTNF